MNRIILIGNGFDLAHGLKTSYRDFIDDFWDKKKEEVIAGLKKNEFNDSYYYRDDFITVQGSCKFENMPSNLKSNDEGYNWFKSLSQLDSLAKSNNHYYLSIQFTSLIF
jgi:hypothetical protein